MKPTLWMHPFTPVVIGAWYWVRTPRGRMWIEQAKTAEHFASGFVGCAISGPIEEPTSDDRDWSFRDDGVVLVHSRLHREKL